MAEWWESAPLASAPVTDEWWQAAPTVETTPAGRLGAALGGGSGAVGAPLSGRETDAASKAGAFAGSVLSGFPVVGPYLDDAAKAAGAFLRSQRTGNPYGDEREGVEAIAHYDREANPKTALAGSVTGGVAGTAPLIAAAPGAFGAGGAGLLARSAASAGSGTALGGADAASRAYHDGGDVTGDALWGAGLGFGVGAAAPGVGQVVGRGVSAALSRLRRPGGSLSGVSAPAANFAQESLIDPAARAAVTADLGRLGPMAMLADVSPAWEGVASAAAARPSSRNTVVNAMTARGAGRNARLGADIDANLGPRIIPSRVEGQIDEAQRALGPLYDQVFDGARAVDTRGLAGRLDAMIVDARGAARGAAQEVRGYLNLHGTNELDPSPRALHEARKAIDGTMRTQAVREDSNLMRIYSNARRAIDEELTAKVPGIKDVDALHQGLARQREALEQGQNVFATGKTALRPEEVTDILAESAAPAGRAVGPQPGPIRYQQGVRAEMDRLVGTKANDAAELQRVMQGEGDWNRDKLRAAFGETRADNALRAIDRETRFYQTQNAVTGNSATALRQSFGKMLDEASRPSAAPIDASILGLLMRGGQKAVGAASQSRANARAARFAGELGELSVAQGPERDRIVTSLIEAIENSQGSRRAGEMTGLLAELALRSGSLQAPAAFNR